MRFQTDSEMQSQANPVFGEYLMTGLSDKGDVRADLFRRGHVVEAHVSFPNGGTPSTVTPYLTPLEDKVSELGYQLQVKHSGSGCAF